MEKKEIKISLGTFVCMIIIAILVVAVIVMGMYIVGNNEGIVSNNGQQGESTNNGDNSNGQLIQNTTGQEENKGNGIVQKQEEILSESEAKTILSQMYSVAESVYKYEKFELVDIEGTMIDKYFWNYEVPNYDLVMEQYFTKKGKQQFESKEDYQKIVVQNGKTYLCIDVNTSSTSYFENMKFENIQISNNKIEADVTAILIYTPGDISEYSRKINTKFVLVKENNNWKIEDYTDRRKDLEWQDTSIKVENVNIDSYQIGCIERPVWNTDYQDLAKRIRTDLQIKYNGNDVYFSVNNADYYNNQRMLFGIQKCQTNGDYLIKGINASNIKESTISFITREQETYLCLVFLTKQGEVYYYSDYLLNTDEISVQKLNITNVVDIEPGYFDIYSDNEIIGEYQDLLIITTDGKAYSFDSYLR